MNTMMLILSFLVILIVFTSIFLWLYMKQPRPGASPLQHLSPKETSSPQVPSDFRTFNSPQVPPGARAFNSPAGWQQSSKNFDSSSLPAQMPLDHMNTNNRRSGLSSSPYNSRYADEKPQIITSGNRSVEHYEQCMHVFYEPRINGLSLVFTNTVITNAVEVDHAFTVCERKFKEALRATGWERAGWIADLGGYHLVGPEATRLMGETLKLFLDKYGLKTKGGLYLIAHYSSKAAPPDQETLNEKLKRIQFITAGVINEFQGNVFDTREEAIAFYLRLRQELLAGR